MRRATILLLLAFIVVTRAALPALDPPYISWSRGEFTDPGFYLNNARSLILTGEPLVGDWNNALLFPVFHSLAYLAWLTAGYGPATTAALLALLAAAAGMLLHLALARAFAPRAGLLALLWFAAAAPLLLLGRVPLLENALLPLLAALLAVRCWPATVHRHLTLLALVIIATATKYSALFMVPALALVSLREWHADCGSLRGEPRWLWLPLTALLLAAVIAVALLQPPALLATFSDKMTRYVHPQFGWHELFLPVETNFFWRMPLLTVSALLMAGLALWQRGRAARPTLVSLAALAAWYLSVVFIRYNPLRYQLVTAPFLIALAVQFWTERRGATPAAATLPRLLLWFILAATFTYSAAYTATRSLLGIGAPRPLLVALAALGGALALACVPRLRRWRWQPPPQATLLVALGIFIVSGPQVYGEWRQRDTRLADIGRAIAQLVPPGGTVAGWYAPSTGLHHRARVYTTYSLTPEKISSANIGYLLLEIGPPNDDPLAGQDGNGLESLRGRFQLHQSWYLPRTQVALGLFTVQP